MSEPSNPYEYMWSKVEEFERKGRPQSALEELEKIYSQSKANNHADDFVKSIIFKLLEKQKFEDTAFQDHLKSLIKDAEETSMPQKAILYLFIAELYKQYASSNYYSIINRTDVENFDNPDLETWTINKINSEALKYIHKALEEPETLLKYTPDSFPTVVVKGSKPSFCRPTLYDLVAYGALNIIDDMRTPTPETFFYAGSEYFDLNQFINMEVKCDNPLSLNYISVQILQQLGRIRATAGNEDALVDFELFRLKRVSEKSCQDNKQELMKEALQLMQQRFSNAKYKSAIDYTLARFYFDQVQGVSEFGEGNSHFRSLAHEICSRIESDETADSEYRNAALNLLADLEAKWFSFAVEEVVPPEANFPVMVNYKNISKLYVKVVKIDESAYQLINNNEYNNMKRLAKYLEVGSIVSSFSKDIPEKGDFLDRSTELIIPKLASCGFYLLILSDDEDFSGDSCSRCCVLRVSNMIATFVRTATGSQQCYIKSRSTGKPLSDITLTLSSDHYDRKLRKNVTVKYSQFKTDKEGYVLIAVPSGSYNSYNITASGPASDTLDCGHFYFYRHEEEQERELIQTFTDRAIYRPGQTVYFKCYVMKTDKNMVTTPVNAMECGVSLRDVNGKEVDFMKAKSNEFGTFGGSLEIPTGLLNGSMSIVVNHKYYTSIRVEEYKRPTFEVTLNHIEGSYLVGEDITVTGNAKSYSGMKIDGAEVKFHVQRVPHFDFHRHFYFMPLRQSPVEIVHGTVIADENGDFKFTFKAVPDAMAGSSPDVAFTYTTSVEITDHSGETRTATQSVTVGFSSLAISVGFCSRHFRDSQFEASVKTTNLDGSPLKLKGRLTVTRLTDNGLLRRRRWSIPDTHSYTKDEWQELLPGLAYEKEYLQNNFVRGATVASREFNTGESSKYVIDELRSVESGSYVIEVTAKDPKTGRDVSNQSYFTVSGIDDKTLPQPSFLEAVVLTENPRVGDVAKVLLGTSVMDGTVLYKVYFGNNELKCEHISLSNSIRILEIPVTQDMAGSNLVLFFSLVQNNCYYVQNLQLTVPDVERKLKIDYLSFRDKLQPGENETWKLRITDCNGRNVSAEMAATLYDKSLDAFAPHSCGIIFPSKSQSWRPSFRTDTLETRHCAHISDRRTRHQSSRSVAYGRINWFGYHYYSPRKCEFDYCQCACECECDDCDDCEEECKEECEEEPVRCEKQCEKAPKMKMARNEASTLASGSAAEPTESTSEVKIRENFNETAFFYPQLRTDENGEIAVEFTIPESLTTWKMLGLAHTQRLQYVFSDKELVTQKQLMVQPNPPRFFRENDRIVLPVKVGNLTAEPLSGSVTLEIIDPFTETQVDGVVRTTTLPFSCNAGGNASLEYELQIPERFSALAYKVIAKSGSFADGEKKVIPVMKNRMLVTESLPLPINGGTSKNYKFEKLLSSGDSSTLRHHKLTLEFTSNPAWYAIQALPYMMEYPYECNEQTFSRLYANSIAAHIAKSSPKIKAVFDAWKQADSNELISNLEKNQELKSLLLQETPWVMEGANETERKKRVGLLFDLNRIAGEESKTLEKLRKNQYPSGGWPWFDGMPESDYVTMHIVAGIGHLKRLGIKVFTGPENAPIGDRAVDYIDGMIEKCYNELKRWHNEKELKEGDFLSFTVIDYLYARSFFVEKAIPNSAKEAFNFYKGKAEEHWLSRDKYSQAMICLALNRFGSTKVPQEILTSLKERSTSSEEMGMYFVDNTAGFLWHQAPIETQSIIIEAFDEVGKDQRIVDLLKIWLLKNKQTNDWKTTKATAEACYALLLRGTDLLADSKICTITLGGMPVGPSVNPDIRSEAGTGYFKTSWGGGEIKPAMGEVSVTNPNQCVAWGALYWQYFEQLDKITLAETPLKLSKKLFREKVTDSGKVIEPVTEETELKPGDKIAVRIEIRTDRDMEYVHLKDMRASGFEPVNVLSGYRHQDGLGYYECTKDASTNFFIEFLPKGTYVFEYRLFVQHRGDFSNGITSIQCMYAPEFTAHSEGVRVKVN